MGGRWKGVGDRKGGNERIWEERERAYGQDFGGTYMR